MRICIIHSSDFRKRGGYSTSFLGFFKGCEIYSTEIFKNFSRRSRKRLFKELTVLKISFAAVCENLFYLKNELLSCGINPVDGREAYTSQMAQMALLFAKENNLPKAFFIQGGSFYTVSRIALLLLEETNDVFVSCADFDNVAEVCADICGAVIRKTPPENPIIIRPAEHEFLLFGKNFLSFSDFGISPSLPCEFNIPIACTAALSSCLKICGFLGDNELNCELLSK